MSGGGTTIHAVQVDRARALARIDELEASLGLATERLALVLQEFPNPSERSDHPSGTKYVLNTCLATLAHHLVL